jgi:hypothetical protein
MQGSISDPRRHADENRGIIIMKSKSEKLFRNYDFSLII